MSSRMLSASAAVAMLGFAVAAQAADECDKMTENIKAMINKVDDKVTADASKCAATGEILGLMRIIRIVREECLPEGEKRISELAEVDSIARGLSTAADMQCQ
jgi:hypothetical protein